MRSLPHPSPDSLPRSVHLSPYHHPKNVYIRTDDPDFPPGDDSKECFACLNQRRHIFGPHDDGFELPEEVEPFLADKPLGNMLTAKGIALWWAPDLYNPRSGWVRRAQGVPLVKNWYIEHCPPGHKVCIYRRFMFSRFTIEFELPPSQLQHELEAC